MAFLTRSTTFETTTLRRSGRKTSRPAQALPALLAFAASAFLLGCGGNEGGDVPPEDVPARETPSAQTPDAEEPAGPEASAGDTAAVRRRSGRAARTVPGYAACTSLPRFHEMMGHVAAEETEAYRAMLEDSGSGCFVLKGDVDVVLVRGTPTFVEIRPPGAESTVWTVPEALDIEGEKPAGGQADPDTASG